MTLKDRILARLRNADGYLSGEVLAQEFGVSRQAISKTVRALTAEGHDVARANNRGYRLLSSDRVLDETLLRRRFPDVRFISARETDSTNSAAHRLFAEGQRTPAFFSARTQREGRGRKGCPFPSPEGEGLYFSLLLFPDADERDKDALIGGIYEKTAAALGCGRDEQALTVGGERAGGMLVETVCDPDRIRALIAGIGVYLRFFPCGETEIAARVLEALLPLNGTREKN